MGNLVWTQYFVLMRFPLNDELDLFWKMILLFENDLESPLIFVLFLKGKQNKKENPKCDSLFWYEKPDRVRGSGCLSGRYGKDRSTPLSP